LSNPAGYSKKSASHSDWNGLNWTFVDQKYNGVQDFDNYTETQTYWTGQWTRMQDSSEVTTWTYDRRGQVLQETKYVRPTASSAKLALNQVTSSGITYAQNTYDAAGRVVSRALGGGVVTTNYGYYPWNQQGQGGRLHNLVSTLNLQNLSYIYNNVGNITQIVDGVAIETLNYSYDPTNRLTGVSGTYSEAYTYDLTSGNLSSKTGLRTYTYDTVHKHAVAAVTGMSFQYDANGNQTTRNVGSSYSLAYDAENRLTSVSSPASATFVYDGDGNRVKSTEGITTTVYIGNYFEWSGSTTTMKRYYYSGAVRVAMRTGTGNGTTGLKWLLEDHLGSRNVIANGDGSLYSRLTYKPWGETRSGVSNTTFKFTGQRQEKLLGGVEWLYYYGSRWYDDSLGRFISPDTVVPGLQGSQVPVNPQAWDLYSYCYNNPVTLKDPNGHDPIPYDQFILQAIAFFVAKGYEVVGNAADAAAKSIYTNGADLVFRAKDTVLAVELKMTDNVNLGTLGKNIAGNYGGSIDRVM